MVGIGKVKKRNIKTELKKFIESGLILGMTQTQLAEHFNVKRQTIATYLTELYSEAGVDDVNRVKISLNGMYNRLHREARTMFKDNMTNSERKEAIGTMLMVMDRYQDFLERFGIKPKPEENIHVTSEVTQKQLVINYIVPEEPNAENNINKKNTEVVIDGDEKD